MSTKEEHKSRLAHIRNTQLFDLQDEQLKQFSEDLASALAERDAQAAEIAELKVQLRYAQEAHSVAESKVDEMEHGDQGICPQRPPWLQELLAGKDSRIAELENIVSGYREDMKDIGDAIIGGPSGRVVDLACARLRKLPELERELAEAKSTYEYQVTDAWRDKCKAAERERDLLRQRGEALLRECKSAGNQLMIGEMRRIIVSAYLAYEAPAPQPEVPRVDKA